MGGDETGNKFDSNIVLVMAATATAFVVEILSKEIRSSFPLLRFHVLNSHVSMERRFSFYYIGACVPF